MSAPSTIITPPTPEIHAYLAGPDVFYPDSDRRGAEKKAALSTLGITGHYPLDNEVSMLEGETPAQFGRRIGALNEQMMLNCCKPGQVGVILVNMTPWHGPSMDVGTAFEAGFMSALAKTRPNVVIVGYYENDKVEKSFFQRCVDHFNGKIRDGIKRMGGHEVPVKLDPHGNSVENFGLEDNLMIPNAIHQTGGAVCYSFEEAAALAKTLAYKKILAMHHANERLNKEVEANFMGYAIG